MCPGGWSGGGGGGREGGERGGGGLLKCDFVVQWEMCVHNADEGFVVLLLVEKWLLIVLAKVFLFCC